MLIRVTCPRCHRVYMLEENLQGQQILCPNAMCREIFMVKADVSAATVPLPPSEQIDLVPIDYDPARPAESQPEAAAHAGSVGDLVPMLPAQAAEQAPLAEIVDLPPPKTASWSDAPPRSHRNENREAGRQASQPAAPTEAAKPTKDKHSKKTKKHPTPPERDGSRMVEGKSGKNADSASAAPPMEMAAGTWSAPPVRGNASVETIPAKDDVEEATENIAPATQETPADDDLDAQFAATARRRRRRRLLIGGLLATGLAAIIVLAIIFLPGLLGQNEQFRFEAATKKYDSKEFADAAKDFHELLDKFPESENRQKYEFLAKLSEIRRLLPDVNPEAATAADQLQPLLVGHEKDDLVKEQSSGVWDACRRLIVFYTNLAKTGLAERNPDVAGVKKNLDRARAWVTIADRLPNVPGSELRPLRENIKTQDEGVAKAQRRHDFLALARDRTRHPPTPEGLDALIRYGQTNAEGFGNEEEFKQIVAALREEVLRNVEYVDVKKPPVKPGAEEGGLVIGIASGDARPGDSIAFAVSRGVLFAFRADHGELIWFARVGVDTTQPPVRLPRDPLGRQAVLVLSSDTNTLTSRDADTGQIRWQQVLGSQMSVGQPLVVNQLAFVPTADDRSSTIHVIETVGGFEIGQYKVGGMRLSAGGVYQPGTNLVYFAAEQDNVYVLDIVMHRCTGILASKHPARSLVTEPVIISREAIRSRPDVRQSLRDPIVNLPDYLILNQADGQGNTRLRVFRLPVEAGKTGEEGLADAIPGLISFAPFVDPEKMLAATDNGMLAVLGIGQVGNGDPPLFLQSINDLVAAGTPHRAQQRAQVLFAQENNYLVLSNGQLQRWSYDVFDQAVHPMWEKPLRLGSPLHTAYVSPDGQALYLVTQLPDQQTCLATAVSAADGKIIWQNQLGFVGQGEPRLLGKQIVALDQGGSLFVVDPDKQATGRRVRTVGQMVGAPLVVGGSASYLVPAPDGKSIYQITTVDRGPKRSMDRYQLRVRRYEPAKELFAKTLELGAAPIFGTPAIESESIVVPLGNGYLRRYMLNANAAAEGPDWRPPNAGADVLGHVLALADGDILVSDGGAHLRRWNWPVKAQAEPFQRLQEITLPAAITSAPLLLPRDDKHPDTRVLVGDLDGNVSVLEGQKLEQKRLWPLKGKITAGPYRSGNHIGCVINKRQLVWLDPDKKDPLWKHEIEGNEIEIVGRPLEFAGMIVVADSGGQFTGLDATTGHVLQPTGYALKANVAPTASPVPYGKDQVAGPLSDGTWFVLSLERLKVKKGPG